MTSPSPRRQRGATAGLAGLLLAAWMLVGWAPASQPVNAAASPKVTQATAPNPSGLAAAQAAAATVAPRSAATGGTPFFYNWNGQSPATPTDWTPANWDTVVHSRDAGTLDSLEFMDAQHGPNCAGSDYFGANSPPFFSPTHTVGGVINTGGNSYAPIPGFPAGSYNDAVFVCNQHVMTAIMGSGYGLVYLTPDRMVDFANGTASVSFNISTLRTSGRDWWDLWITPFNENLDMPLDNWIADLVGPPHDAIHIRLDFNNDAFLGEEVLNCTAAACDTGQVMQLPGDTLTPFSAKITPDAKIRTKFQLDLSTGHVRFGMPNYDGKGTNFYWIDTDLSPAAGAGLAPLPFTRGIIQLGHHSYNPMKDRTTDCPAPTFGETHSTCPAGTSAYCQGVACLPDTWHWSDFYISNSVPFTMIRGDQSACDPGPANTYGCTNSLNANNTLVRFPAPAPPNAHLRFSAVADLGNYSTGAADPTSCAANPLTCTHTSVQVSFNGGAYQDAPLQTNQSGRLNGGVHQPELFANYWMPIPVGTTSVRVRAQDSFGGAVPWHVHNMAIWSPDPPLTLGQYHPLSPARIFDTRDPNSQHPGRFAPGESRTIQITNYGGIPSLNVTGVVLNMTVTNPSGGGYLTVWPSDVSQPLASSLNWSPGETVPNLVTVPVAVDGTITIYDSPTSSVDVIADVAGYYGYPTPTSDGLYVPLSPSRSCDTRAGTGTVCSGHTLPPNGMLNLTVGGAGSVPASAEAAVLNVTVTNTGSNGYLTVFPAGASQPLASNLNWGPGQTVPNRVIVKLGTGGAISIFNGSNGNSDVVVDVGGYYTGAVAVPGAAQLILVTPTRICDTRLGTGTLCSGHVLAPNGILPVSVAGVASAVPALSFFRQPKGVVLNVTVTNPSLGSYLTVYPSDLGSPPLISDLNWVPGETVPNMVAVKLGTDGNLKIYNQQGQVDVVVDVVGWYG